MSSSLTTATALSIYRRMSTIRTAEERIIAGRLSGEFTFTYYPVRGQEAIAATVGELLRPTDQLASTYRCFHDVVAKGTPMREIIAEQMGRLGGTSKGKGGPMHISDPRSGLMVTTGIVGGGLPIAVGLGLAAQLDRSDRVALVSFGDGATSIGATHEAMNMASLWSLPLIFLCQNNMWGEHTPLAGYTKSESLAARASAYSMQGVTVDGRKPQELHGALDAAIGRARSGRGPTFIEACTYRILPHSFGLDQSYQPRDELRIAEEEEPVKTFRQWLLDGGHATAAQLSAIESDAASEVADAVQWASSSEAPPLDELLADVYSTPIEVPQ